MHYKLIVEQSKNGTRTQEAFEAAGGAEELDARQAGRRIRAASDVRSAQVARVVAAHSVPAQPTEVRAVVQRGQDDLQTAADQGGRQGAHRDALPRRIHGYARAEVYVQNFVENELAKSKGM